MIVLLLKQGLLWQVLLTSLHSSQTVAAINAEQEPLAAAPLATTVNRVDVLRERLRVDAVDGLGEHSASDAAQLAMNSLGGNMRQRLESLFDKAHSSECRQKIVEHFGYFVNAIGLEKEVPFVDIKFTNECDEPVYDWNNLPKGMHIGNVQNRTYQPPRNESTYIENPQDLKLLFGILTHDNSIATIRLIEALYEPGHSFVVHVDAKYSQTQEELLAYASTRDHVHILRDPRRIRVNWGGFTMVNATLQLLQYAIQDAAIDFHKFVHMSSSTYPLASNPEIRHKLASFPLDANFLYVILQPSRPTSNGWHYFVECDDALHRIYQLQPLRRETAGIDLFTGSQWFIIGHEFAEYLAVAEPGSFVDQFARYSEHIVVADETFFGTVLRNTKYCQKHHNVNFLHLQFDRWESDIPIEQRDQRKCPMPNPDHCGRSPTTMTIDYADILELSADLFARKFDDAVDTKVKDIIDDWRARRERAILHDGLDPEEAFRMKSMSFEGHGVLIVAKETVSDPVPLCLAIGSSGNQAKLLPCFIDAVPPTLAAKWEQGAVILPETVQHTRWDIGPCTTDGRLDRIDETGHINVTLGDYSATGPRCMLQQKDGLRAGRCWDGGPLSLLQPGGPSQVYPCVREWFQFVSFGDGRIAPNGALFITMPSHIAKQVRQKGTGETPYICLGVHGRGHADELKWDGQTYIPMPSGEGASNKEKAGAPLSEWIGEPVITTQCSNTAAVIEWVYVPFIAEEDAVEIKEGVTVAISEKDGPDPIDSEL